MDCEFESTEKQQSEEQWCFRRDGIGLYQDVVCETFV